MAETPASLAPALDLFRRGDLTGARTAAEQALAAEPDNAVLRAFAGLAAARSGDPAGAVPHFRHAVAANPGDVSARLNLATALVAIGELDEAGTICAEGSDPRLLRLAAYVHQQQGRLAEAAAAYDAALAARADDWESFNNLGNVRAALGETDAAIAAFQQAIRLRPDLIEIVINLSNLLGRADRHEERQAMMHEAARAAPDDARVQAELGVAEAEARDFDAAEAAYRAAIRNDPDFMPAYVELGLLFETRNRLADLEQLLDAAAERGLAGPEFGFLRAWLLRRQGRFAEALPLAEATPPSINPARRAQLLGEIHDRLGDSARAFAAFTEMNRAADAARPAPTGSIYRDQVVESAALLTAQTVAAWSRIDLPTDPPAPAFVIGFPRSGTTLLDTLLMNMPALHVLEEMPIVDEVALALGGEERLATLASEEAGRLRQLYFDVLADVSPPAPGQMVIDKFPLHMARMALVHRLFPDARIVFVERHPCDTVLSCFMSNFQLNHAMRSFTDLMETARLYDAVFDAWSRARDLLPLDVHVIRYENMVADLEGTMRPLLDFLRLPWDPKVLDNQAAAEGRDYIRTASYAQVAEPIYSRAAGRWQRYRDQLAPVLPILAPWAERLGYEL
ncbi:MAG TPA: sulfotransferase [Allosphingosinicella sp.]